MSKYWQAPDKMTIESAYSLFPNLKAMHITDLLALRQVYLESPEIVSEDKMFVAAINALLNDKSITTKQW